MKKFAALFVGCLLTLTPALAGNDQADQKWLQAVQKMIVDGQKQVSTPSQDRVNLLKDWAQKNSYSVQVTKTDSGFRVEVTKHLAAK